MLDNKSNQPSKFRTKNWVEISDKSRRPYFVNKQITFKKTNKKVIFKNYAPFTNCISKVNNTLVDNAKDIDIVMQMYNLIEYNDNY